MENCIPSKEQPQPQVTFGECYIGTKVIRAIPMDNLVFMREKGVNTENIESNGDGYKVMYEDGYTSWSPKEVFERCYRKITKKELNLIDG